MEDRVSEKSEDQSTDIWKSSMILGVDLEIILTI
jgi:hypothetical protein